MTAREKLNELKKIWGFETDKELANFIGTNKTNIDSWVKRNKIPDKWVLIIEQLKPLMVKNSGNYIKTIQTNHGSINQGKTIITQDQPIQDPREKTLIDKFRTLSELGKAEAEACINKIYIEELKNASK